MTKRKSKVLKVALDIFNKVQSQNISTFKLNDIEEVVSGQNQGQDSHIENVDEVLQKFEILLENPRSPLISALQNLATYKGDKGLPGFSKLFSDLDGVMFEDMNYTEVKKEYEHLN